MADISNLSNYLKDVADAIREKKGTEDQIPAANFDTEIRSIETGGGSAVKNIYNNTKITLLDSILYEGNQINMYIRSFYPYNIVSFENIDGYFLLDFSGDDYKLIPFETTPNGTCIIGVYDNCIYVWSKANIYVYDITTAEQVKIIAIPSEYQNTQGFGMSNFCFSGNSNDSAKSIMRLDPKNDTLSLAFDISIMQSVYTANYYASFGDNRYGILNRCANSNAIYPAIIFDYIHMTYYTAEIGYLQGISDDLSMCIVNGSLYNCNMSDIKTLTKGSLLKSNVITSGKYLYNVIDNVYYLSSSSRLRGGELYELDVDTYAFSKTATITDYKNFILTNEGSVIGYYIDGNAYYIPMRNISLSGEYLITGKEAYNEFNQVIQGTMPNNGELNYQPSTEEQVIPKGYTDGGTIAASQITNEEYEENLALTKQILGVV